MTDFTAFPGTLNAANKSLATLSAAIADLTELRDAATAEIAKYLRIDSSIKLNIDAIRATLTKPYTILPIDEHQAWLIHWRGIEMPIFGWVVATEEAFVKARITRSMNLLTPLPTWMMQELGWKPPEHTATMDGSRTSIRVTSGDTATFRKRYGSHLGVQQADGSFKIKGGDAWIRLVTSLIGDGILPYAAVPVAKKDWKEPKVSTLELRDYQLTPVNEFRAKGAVFVNYPPGAGKTIISAYILQRLQGRFLILADTSILTEQWRARVKQYAPEANVVVSTYQGAAKYVDEEWDLVIFDECQRLPANTFSKLAFIKTKYRLGLSATAWREDERQALIPALSGFPVHVPWALLVRAGVLKRPRIIVATVATQAAKTAYVKQLVASETGRVLIFCDWLEEGQALADALDVPFVNGASTRKLQQIEESRVCVVSRIGDRGLDLPDLKLAIEVAGQGAAREQFAQRAGRLLHSDFYGRFITVFTTEEAEKNRARIFGVEAELAGEVDIEFINIGNSESVSGPTPRPARRPATTAPRPSPRRATPRPAAPKASAQPDDEIAKTMRLPAVAVKLDKAKATLNKDSVRWADRAFRLCYGATFTPKDIAEGYGLSGVNIVGHIRTACRSMKAVGLLAEPEKDHFTIDESQVSRLRNLAKAMGKG